MRIGVVGCGTAGPAAALLLHRAGHDVTVFEQVARPLPVGAGILLQPTGRAVLARLGLADAVERRGARIERLRGTTPGGKVIMDLPYAALHPDLFGLGVHRGELFTILFDALRESGVALRLGVDVVGTRERGEARLLVDAEGNRHGPFDLVVVADGARSRLRGELPVQRARPYRWSALWFIGEDPDGAFDGALSQVFKGTRRLVGFLPTGTVDGAPLVSFFWGLRDVDAWRAGGLERWKAEVRAVTARAEPLLDQIERPDQLIHAVYHDVIMKRWHAPGIVYLGDAAHAMSPHLGQGANLALMDAAALADHLPDLAAYEAERRSQTGYYQRASRWLMPLFQSGHVYLGPLRDLLIPLGLKVPWLRKQALQTMAGQKTTLLTAQEYGAT